jgi:hypothetical protein
VTAGGAARRLSWPAPVPDLVSGHVHNSSQGALSALEHAEYVPKPRAEVVRVTPSRARACLPNAS